MSNARNLARLLPNASGQLPDAAMSSGSVLQVVSAQFSGATTTGSNIFVATNITASITPSSTTSKILVIGHVFVNGSTNQSQPNINMYRNGAADVGALYGLGNVYANTAGYMEAVLPFTYLSSPESTSAQTYTLYGRNPSNSGTSTFGDNSRRSTITLMEIAA